MPTMIRYLDHWATTAPTFFWGTTLKRRYFTISRQLIISLRDLLKFLISSFPCDSSINIVEIVSCVDATAISQSVVQPADDDVSTATLVSPRSLLDNIIALTEAAVFTCRSIHN
ncbi:hypothetical protein TNCV_1821011 [Trichonephila clavipes]|nr:hypothetical protein TNCV_1821011 [Trichonephila clavipes]